MWKERKGTVDEKRFVKRDLALVGGENENEGWGSRGGWWRKQ